jgi:hypothetical protein
MQLPVPHDVIEDSSSKHNAAWQIFYAHHLSTAAPHCECINAYTSHVDHSYSVVQTNDTSAAWNQNLLLQEQKLSAAEKQAMLQCGEQAYEIHIPFM